MHIRVLAVGDRQPAWVNTAFEDYAGRLPRDWRFTLKVLSAAQRSKKQDAAPAVRAEGRLLLNEMGSTERVIALDERGQQRSSKELADWLGRWQSDGRDVCLLIGGADGLSDEVMQRAEHRWSLSRLTLPHGLVRVVLAEQLYRAWSLQAGPV